MSESPASKSHEHLHVYDIEHVPVVDDPRRWSTFRKNFTLALVAAASMNAGLSANIQNPAVEEMHKSLGATSEQFSLSISLFILLQGVMPLMWSAVSEIKGRKLVYLTSLAIFTAASVAVSLSPNMKYVIGFRCLQAAGSSAVMTIGGSTLADIFDPEERGTKMGIYYIAPLLGPVLGPILGGALTVGFGWRAIFWFLTIFAGVSCLSFLLFFKDTYRKERSLVYQEAFKSVNNTTIPTFVDQEKGERELPHNSELDLMQVNVSLRDLNPFKPMWLILRRLNNLTILIASGLSFAFNIMLSYTAARTLGFKYGYSPLKIGLVTLVFGIDCLYPFALLSFSVHVVRKRLYVRKLSRWTVVRPHFGKVERSKRGCRLPRDQIPSPLQYGFSDTTLLGAVAALGWIWEEKAHIAVVCVIFFFNGFFFIWPYSSALAYIVDANQGRSSTALAMNSVFRCVFAFVAIEVVVPLQDGLGDGWMMTLWAFLMLTSGLVILLTYWKGKSWRESAELSEAKNLGTEQTRAKAHASC
ncbi:hypothetical protein APHAL10511_002321 [Amanita phalloides]|nr:hypothetical protein APHAL10511_002321 [Amanita phalloides]